MKSFRNNLALLVAALVFGSLFLANVSNTYAEEDSGLSAEDIAAAATSISISPVSKILQLSPNTVYEDSFKVTNNGSGQMNFEVYAAPYAYTYSEDEDAYKLGFSHENVYTQITRWITFQDTNGNYVENPTFVAEPNSSVTVNYRISTPDSVPAGGQYAVLFAHTLSSATNASGIKTEASPGLVVYGRSTGETITSAEISELQLSQNLTKGEETKTVVNASAKVKNTGNVDFMAVGSLRVEGIFGRSYYETPTNKARTSIIPDSEIVVSDEWEDTPFFGLFKATWTVSAAGQSETSEQMILIMPPIVIIIALLLLTIVIVWIIIVIRKRKERRSRFMV